MAAILVWGAGGHARVVADIIRRIGSDEIIGFIDEVAPYRRGEPFLGSIVLGGEEQIENLRSEHVNKAIVAVGDCAARLRISELLKSRGFELATAIHPSAIVSDGALLGPGTVVCAGAVIGPGVRAGMSTIVNTSASVDHDCTIGDGAHIGPGARLGGGVHVGRGAWVAIGATIVNGIEIGDGAIVGAGGVVPRSVPARSLVFGVPAREHGQRNNDNHPLAADHFLSWTKNVSIK